MTNQELQRMTNALGNSKTVLIVFFTALIYLIGRFFDASEEVVHGALVVGFALAAIYMRRTLQHVFRDIEVERTQLLGQQATPPREAKPLYRSMTVISAVLMVLGYFVSKYQNLSAGVQQTILVVGMAAIFIYMRRAMIAIFREHRA